MTAISPGSSTSATDRPASTPRQSPAWLVIGTLARRELVRFFRQRTRVIGALGQPVLFWILFGAGLHGSFQPPAWAPAGMSYQEYFFPGVAVMIVMFTAIFSTISIIEDRREGFLQGVLVAPISRLSLVLGKVAGGTMLAVLQAGLFLALAPWMGIGLSWQSAAAVFACLTLIACGLTALGFAIAWPMESTQGFHAIMSVFLMPMWLLSGAFFPAADSGWLAWVIRLNPLTYGLAALRRLLYWDQPLPVSDSLPGLPFSLAVMGLFTVACIGLAVALTHRRASRDAR